MNDFVLQVKNLDKSFGKSNILQNINLTIGKGEVYGLIGENGAGKTTLLRLIGGLVRPSGGSITIRTDKQFIGYMPQSCRFSVYQSVANTIRFFSTLKKTGEGDTILLTSTVLSFIYHAPVTVVIVFLSGNSAHFAVLIQYFAPLWGYIMVHAALGMMISVVARSTMIALIT